jgi:hypothetical protein
MTPVQIVLLVVGILGLQVLIWIPILLWLRRKTAAMQAQLAADLAASGEKVLRAPEPGLYTGATERFSKVNGNAVIALTDKRLVVRKVVGEGCEVPLAELTGVREDKWFRRAYRGRLNVIVQLAGGVEVGFIAHPEHHAAWMDELRGRVAKPA